MKLGIVLLAALLVGRAAEALYSGNPDEPELLDNGLFLKRDNTFGIEAGYQGDFVFDRRMHATSGAHCRIDDFQSRMNQGVLTFNFMNRLEVFGSAGAMNAYTSFRPHGDGKRREFQMSDHITWGAGGRILIGNWGNAHVGATGAYQYSKMPVKWNSVDGHTYSTDANMKYWEWQVALLLSYRVEMFDPYIGATYSVAEAVLSHVKENMDLHHRKITFKNRDRVGMALGCSLTPSNIVDLNVEVRLFDEEAIMLAGNVKF